MARVQYLAHLVAESLISLAENMQGKRDNTRPGLKIQLDEYEAYVLLLMSLYQWIHAAYSNDRILHNVLKVVKQHTSSSSMMALINAGDRAAITMLKERLSDMQRSIPVS